MKVKQDKQDTSSSICANNTLDPMFSPGYFAMLLDAELWKILERGVSNNCDASCGGALCLSYSLTDNP
jgi:hypothetical protein